MRGVGLVATLLLAARPAAWAMPGPGMVHAHSDTSGWWTDEDGLTAPLDDFHFASVETTTFLPSGASGASGGEEDASPEEQVMEDADPEEDVVEAPAPEPPEGSTKEIWIDITVTGASPIDYNEVDMNLKQGLLQTLASQTNLNEATFDATRDASACSTGADDAVEGEIIEGVADDAVEGEADTGDGLQTTNEQTINEPVDFAETALLQTSDSGDENGVTVVTQADPVDSGAPACMEIHLEYPLMVEEEPEDNNIALEVKNALSQEEFADAWYSSVALLNGQDTYPQLMITGVTTQVMIGSDDELADEGEVIGGDDLEEEGGTGATGATGAGEEISKRPTVSSSVAVGYVTQIYEMTVQGLQQWEVSDRELNFKTGLTLAIDDAANVSNTVTVLTVQSQTGEVEAAANREDDAPVDQDNGTQDSGTTDLTTDEDAPATVVSSDVSNTASDMRFLQAYEANMAGMREHERRRAKEDSAVTGFLQVLVDTQKANLGASDRFRAFNARTFAAQYRAQMGNTSTMVTVKFQVEVRREDQHKLSEALADSAFVDSLNKALMESAAIKTGENVSVVDLIQIGGEPTVDEPDVDASTSQHHSASSPLMVSFTLWAAAATMGSLCTLLVHV